MSRISEPRPGAHAGFTLVELMVAGSISLFVCGGILAAYLFLGRSLTRLVNLQQQEVQSRRTLRLFTQDLSAAIQLTTSTSSQVAITKPAASGTTTVIYAYDSGARTLARTDATRTLTILSGLTMFTITYFNESGTAVTSSPQSVKAIELSFSTAVGSAASGTLAGYTTVSPRIVLRNKPALQ